MNTQISMVQDDDFSDLEDTASVLSDASFDSNESDSGSNSLGNHMKRVENDSEDELAFDIGDDDEDIDSDDLWTAEDEAKWGDVLNPILDRNDGTGRLPRRIAVAADEDDGTDAEYASSDDEDGFDDDDMDEEEEEEEDGVTWADLLDTEKPPSGLLEVRKDDSEDESDSDGEDGGLFTDEQHAALLKLVQDLESQPGVNVAQDDKAGKKRKRTRRIEEEGGKADMDNALEASGTGVSGARSNAIAAARSLLSASAKGSSDLSVDLGSLVSSLSGTEQFDGLRKRLEKLVGRSLSKVDAEKDGPINPVPLRAPPPTVVVERSERQQAYAESSKAVGGWSDLVAVNRRAEHLSFTAETMADTRHTPSTYSLASSFTPGNEYEVAIATALSVSGMGAVPGQSVYTANGRTTATGDKAVLAAEEAEMLAMAQMGGVGPTELQEAEVDIDAVQERQRTLAKMKALLFYDELKKRRLNKIKSKTYRRIRKRADARRGKEEIEELRKQDPEAARLLLEEEARIIAKERMTLKHRASGRGVGGSKWVKRVLARGGGAGKDENREALVEHLQRAEALAARIRGMKEAADSDDSDHDLDEDSEDYDMDVEDVLRQGKEAALAELDSGDEGAESDGSEGSVDEYGVPKPKKKALPKGLMGMKFMQNAVNRAKATAGDHAREMAEMFEKGALAVGAGKAFQPMDMKSAGNWALSDDEGDSEEEVSRERFDSDEDDGEMSDTVDEGAGGIDGDDEGGVVAKQLAKRAKKHAQRKKESGLGAEGLGTAEAPSRRVISGSSEAGAKGKGSKKGAVAVPAADGVISISTGVGSLDVPMGADVEGGQGKVRKPRAKQKKTEEPVQVESTPWMRQGGATFLESSTSGSNADSASGDNSNPWLENAYSTGEISGGKQLAAKRAMEAARSGAASSETLDVAGALDSIASMVDQHVNKGHKGASVKLMGGTYQAELPTLSSEIKPTSESAIGADRTEKTPESLPAADENNDEGSVPLHLDQAELIRRAFTGVDEDEAAAALMAEKEEEAQMMADSLKPGSRRRGDRDPSMLSGWGSWAGMGSESVPKDAVTIRHEKSMAAKAALKAKKDSELLSSVTSGRKDLHLGGVFISEKRDRKLASKQAKSVPHQFKTAEQYEASLRQPLGKEWNTATSAASLNKPEFTTRTGMIINPIQQAKVIKKQGPEVARLASKAASMGQGKKKLR